MTRPAPDGGGDSLAYPDDDPEAVRAAVRQLDAISGGIGCAGDRIGSAAAAAPGVWEGVAEGRCAAEVHALQTLLGRTGTQLAVAREALHGYARALDAARADVDGLRRRRDAAVAARDAEVRDLATTMASAPPALRELARREVDEDLQWRMVDIRRDHAAVLSTVRHAATAAGARLQDATTAIRGVANGTAADTRHAVLAALPLLDEQQASAAADRAVRWLQAAAYDDDWLAAGGQFQEWADDPYFATRLLTRLGPEELLRVPFALSVLAAARCGAGSLQPLSWEKQQELHGRIDSVLLFLGTTLAAGTRSGAASWVGDQWVRDLEREASNLVAGDTYGWFSVGQLLQHGSYDTRFLVDIASAADASDRDSEWRVWRMTAPMQLSMDGYVEPGVLAGGWDPMVGVSLALSKNREAALQFLTPDRLERLLTDRGGWGDDGLALGKLVVTAAATERDLAAAGITARMVHDLAAHGGGMPDGLRSGVADVLAAHIGDVSFAIYAGSDAPHRGGPLTAAGNLPWLGDAQPPAAVLGAGDLAQVLRGVTSDADAYRRLVDAETAWMKLSVESAARLGGPQHQLVAGVESTAADAATVLGFLTQAHDDATSADARAHDAAHNRLVDLAKSGAGLVPVPGGKLVGFGVDQLIDTIADHLRSDTLSAAQHAAGQDAVATRALVLDSVATAMVGAGLFPAGHDPQTWLAAQPVEVQAHPFVDDQGRLLSPDRMDDQAWRGYAQWLHEPGGAASTIGVTAQRVADGYAAARSTAADYLR